MRFVAILFFVLFLPGLAFASISNGDDSSYLNPTVQNLSKLYWALGMFNSADDAAIEQYIRINDCDGYNEYWQNKTKREEYVRKIRKMLDESAASFSKRLEIVVPLGFGTYDSERKRFKIDPASQFVGVKRIDVAPNIGAAICGSYDDIKNYPRNIILNLDKPFTLTAIPVKPELAEKIIEWEMKKGVNPSGVQDLVDHYPSRIAYLRFKITVGSYVETTKLRGHWRAVVVGYVDDYEVYADREMRSLLYAR